MELSEWLKMTFGANRVDIVKGLHVIGTCGECKYYSKPPTFPYGYCKVQKDFSNHIVVKPDFGCIHFEQKEAKELFTLVDAESGTFQYNGTETKTFQLGKKERP